MSLINGLPAHVLIVHLVVVLVPLAALLAVISVVWPAARRRLGFLTPLAAVAAAASVPLALEAGEWLEEHVPESPLVESHSGYGDKVLPWVVAFVIVVVVAWLIRLPRLKDTPIGKIAGTVAAQVVVAVLVIGLSAGAVFAVYKAGDSGAKAAWNDKLTSSGS